MSGAGVLEKYRTAKELSGDLLELGIRLSAPGVRITLVELRVPRVGYSARLSDLLRALQDHPDHKPFAKSVRERSPVTVL